jgi:hypothetical protein
MPPADAGSSMDWAHHFIRGPKSFASPLPVVFDHRTEPDIPVDVLQGMSPGDVISYEAHDECVGWVTSSVVVP